VGGVERHVQELALGSYRGIRLAEIRRFGRAIRSKDGEFRKKVKK